MSSRLIVVDGSNYIFRAFFALQKARAGGRNIQLTTSTGMPTGALHVFSNMLTRLYLDEKPELCAVVFDAGEKTFRNDIDPEYKANREEPPDELKPQFPWFGKIVEAFQLPVLRIPHVEADDVIATLVRRARARGLEVVIYTGDKDLMQLVDEHVRVVDTMNDKSYDPAAVTEKFGVPPAKVAEWLSLSGDSVDNIPGVEGVGKATATKLLTQYGDIDSILAAADRGEIKGKLGERLRDATQRDNLARSRKLVALKDDVELPCDVLELKRRDWNLPALAEVFRQLEFSRLLARLETTFVSHKDRYRTLLAADAPSLPQLAADLRQAGELAVHVAATADGARGRLHGLGVTAAGVPATYLPVAHRYLGAPAQLSAEQVLSALGPLLADESLPKHVHDAKSALLVLSSEGADLRGVRCDVMLASYLLDATQTSHALPELARQHISHDAISVDQLVGKGKSKKALPEVDVAAAAEWGAEAADLTLALAKLLRPRLENAGLAELHDTLELPLSRVLAVMEKTGIRVETQLLRRLGQKLGEDVARLEKAIQAEAGTPINVQSPKQLGELLFEKLGLRSEKMRKTSLGYSTDAEQLEELVDAHPIVKLILEHRELSKLKSTYLDELPLHVDPETHRLHTSYLQAVATTGRLSSKHPNIQNIPVRTALGREIRRAFVADPGMTLVSADYSQIELRVIAHLSHDPVLVHAFEQGIDVHAQTAAEVFGVPLAEVTPEHRRVAKAVNYGLGYGQTDFGLSRALDIPRDDARRYIERYFQRFAGVSTYMQNLLAEAHKALAVTTILGRRVSIPALGARNYGERSAAERLARNAPIQGSAADILKLAMLRCQELCEKSAGAARMLLTVHDELVFEVADERAQAFADEARHAMETAYRLAVPLQVDVGIAKSWADAH
jgi:DNA polymerase-1